MSWFSRAVSSVTKPLRNLGVAIDRKVGGAEGWAKVTGVGAAVVSVVPGIGTAAAGALGATAAGLKMEANRQAQAKANREAAALAAAAPFPALDGPGGLPSGTWSQAFAADPAAGPGGRGGKPPVFAPATEPASKAGTGLVLACAAAVALLLFARR